MSRTRPFLLAALAGILITTGGCADSATAPSAAADASLDRTQGDSASTTNRPGDDDGTVTIQSGYIISGGRASN